VRHASDLVRSGGLRGAEWWLREALKRQPASGLQNRNASGFQMLDKANPGRVTRDVVAGRLRH
jgi:hypothetical protein